MIYAILFLSAFLFATPATSAPEVSYCLNSSIDPSCVPGDTSTSGTIAEKFVYPDAIHVYARSNTGDPQVDNWCTIKTHWRNVLVEGYPYVGIKGKTPVESDAGAFALTVGGNVVQELWYLKADASDDSIVDGTGTWTYIGHMSLMGSYLSIPQSYPAPCEDGTMYFEPITTEPTDTGLALTYVDAAWSCGGVDPTDGVQAYELTDHVRDYEPANSTTITVTLIADTDQDGVHNSEDNCVYAFNSYQRDTNGDGYGNLCDYDYNNDGVVNTADYIMLSAAWGCPYSSPCYDPDIDRDGDGEIGTPEFIGLSAAWGNTMAGRGLDLCAP